MNVLRSLAAFALAIALAGPASAGELSLKLAVGFADTAFAERFCPARISIVNDLEELDAELVLEVVRGSTPLEYRKPVHLGKGFRGTIAMTFWCDPDARLRARLVRRGTSADIVPPVRPERLEIKPDGLMARATPRVLAIVGGSGAHPRVSLDGWLAVHVRPRELPADWLGYDAITALVVSGNELDELDDWQARALRTWLALGGELYGLGAIRRWQPDGLLDELLPVRIVDSVDLISPEFHRPGSTATDTVPTFYYNLRVARLQLAAGAQELLRARARPYRPGAPPGLEEDWPLFVRRAHGLGWVGFAAMEVPSNAPAGSPREEQASHDRLAGVWQDAWRAMLRARERAPALVTAAPGQRIEEHLRNVPGRPIPRAWVVLFMILFCLAIGPVDYLVLRGIGRFHLSLLTFPLLVGGFTAVAYLVSYAGRAERLAFRAITVVDVLPSMNLMRGTTYCVAFSPDAADHVLDTNLPDAHLALMEDAGERRPATVYPDAPSKRIRLPMKIWTGKRICCRWVIEDYAAGDTASKRLAEAATRLGLWRGRILSNAGARDLSVFDPRDLGAALFRTAPARPLNELLTEFGRAAYIRTSGPDPTLLWWLSFGPARTGSGEDASSDGLPTELSLRRNLERGRVYLVGPARTSPLEIIFSGARPGGDHAVLVRIDVTDQVDPDRWR